MLTFNLLGIPVRVEPWFWLTMLIIGSSAPDIIHIAIFVAAGFCSILVHELGHALTIRKYGHPTSITLVAFGGFASYPAGVLNRTQSFLVTAAGPGIQMVMGLLLFALLHFGPIPQESLLRVLVFYLSYISIIWAVFNCLPIYPMDGGQMLSSILGPKRQKYVYLIGAVCAIIIGLVFLQFSRFFILPIFMGFLAWKNFQDFLQNNGSTR